jgi:tripartite-type tricarboxylate transporter receptor subunit TctC
MRRVLVSALILGMLSAAAGGSASADETSDFYSGKRLTFVVGSEAGSGYDAYARLLARNIVRFIPGNPEAIVQNKPGAGSITAINAVYNTLPQDGTVIVSLNRTAPFSQILGHSGAQFDPVKLNWLGSLFEEIGLLVVDKKAGAPTLADARRKPVIIGATSPGTDSVIFPALLNNTIGTRFQLVQGYGGMDGIYLAFARGEIQGQESSLESTRRKIPNWRSEADIPVQFGLRKHRELPDVPLVLDRIDPDWIAPGLTVQEVTDFWRFILAQTRIGRPFALGPNVPKARMAALRAAFDATVRDNVFLEQAGKSQLDIDPVGGAEIDALIAQAASLPRPTIEKLKAEINYKGASVTAPTQP